MRLGAIGGLAALGLVLTASLPAPPAAAQMETREGIALQNQILELQREIQGLQAQVQAEGNGGGYAAPTPYGQPQEGGGGGSDLVATLLSRVEQLQSAVRDLRGQVQDLTNQLQQQTAELGKRIDDLQFQVQNPGAASASGTAAAPGSSAQGTLSLHPPPPPPPRRRTAEAAPTAQAHGKRTPELDLRDGSAALRRHDYAAAERDARAVLANKLSPHAAEAQYVLAEALLGQKKYSQAAIAFDDSYNRSRKGPYAPNALVGLANSLIAINEKRAACDTIVKLRAEFPHESDDVRTRAASAARRAGCH